MRSEWTRKTAESAATASTEIQSLPADHHHTIRLELDGRVLASSFPEQVSMIRQREVYLRAWGVFWITFDSSGDKELRIYPEPGSGSTLTHEYVFEPVTLSATTDVPPVPAEFHKHIVDYAAAEAYRTLEDNPDMAEYFEGKFDKGVGSLTMLRRKLAGSGPVQMRVQGIHT